MIINMTINMKMGTRSYCIAFRASRYINATSDIRREILLFHHNLAFPWYIWSALDKI